MIPRFIHGAWIQPPACESWETAVATRRLPSGGCRARMLAKPEAPPKPRVPPASNIINLLLRIYNKGE
jgi:hypothetical protein